MALGTTSIQPRFENPREILGDRLREGSIYRLLADEGDRLLPDDYFADLYTRAHLSVDSDSELIDDVVLTPANTPDKGGGGTRRAPRRPGGRARDRRWSPPTVTAPLGPN